MHRYFILLIALLVLSATTVFASVPNSLNYQGRLTDNSGSACCIGSTGNIDCDPNDITDITDLTFLIDHLFLSLQPLCCPAEGNINGDPANTVGITDLTVLIDHLFISLVPTATCVAPVNITLVPPHAAPGAPIKLVGLQLDTTKLATYTIFFGNEQSLLSSSDSGAASTVAPLFYDTVLNWHLPPTDSMDVLIFQNDVLIAQSLGAFVSDSLPTAPGTTQQIVSSIDSLNQSFKSILAAFPLQPGFQDQVFFALSNAIDSFMIEEDIQGALDSLAAFPDAVALLDAYNASSGGDQAIIKLNDGFSELAVALNRNPIQRRGVIGEDVILSEMMQLAGILDQFQKNFISGTSAGLSDLSLIFTSLSNLSTGFSGFVKNLDKAGKFLKMLNVLKIGYSFSNLVFAKLVVSSLPTDLDSLTIRFGVPDPLIIPSDITASIYLGDTTVNNLTVWASNNPKAITAGDLLGQFLNLAGLFLPEAVTDKEQALAKMKTLVGLLRTFMNKYSSLFPNESFDPGITEIISIPKMSWDAIIQDTNLVQLNKTANNPVVNILQGELAWEGSDTGTVNVSFEPIPVSHASWVLVAILPVVPFPFFDYRGTSFGIIEENEPFSSKLYPITVGRQMFIRAEFPDTVFLSDSTVLQVSAGYINNKGDSVSQEGILIDLFVEGGLATPESGTTNALFGRFTSQITSDSLSDTITIIIVATDDFSIPPTQVTDTVKAVVTESVLQTIAFMRKDPSDNIMKIWVMSPLNQTSSKIVTVPGSFPRNLIWSSDHKALSFSTTTRNVGTDLFVVEGRPNPNFLFKVNQREATKSFAWDPSIGDHFVFTEKVRFGGQLLISDNIGIDFIRDTVAQELGVGGLNIQAPSISPDGTSVSYWVFNGQSIDIVKQQFSDSTRTRSVLGSAGNILLSRVNLWTANSTYIVYLLTPINDASAPVNLMFFNNVTGATLDGPVKPSITLVIAVPGTDRIIYGTGPFLGLTGLFIYDPETGQDQLIPGTANLNPSSLSVSSDGFSLLFDDVNSGLNLFMIDIPTGVKTQLTQDGGYSFPTWSNYTGQR